MKKKIVPIRHCIVCNAAKDKSEFIRIVCNKQGEISADPTGKAQGRGAYICKCRECFERAKKSNRLEKSFGIKITSEFYDSVIEEFSFE